MSVDVSVGMMFDWESRTFIDVGKVGTKSRDRF